MRKSIQFKFLTFSLLTFLFACNTDINTQAAEQNSNLVLTDSLSFKTGMTIRRRYAGLFLETKTKAELFYCFNTTTTRKLKFFDINTELIEEIQLDSVLINCKAIDGINIISLDTIVVLSQYTNKLFFLNRKGNIIKQLNLDDIIQKNSDDYYEFSSSINGPFVLNDSTFVLHATHVKSTSVDNSHLTHFELLEKVCKNYWKKPNLVTLNHVFDKKPSFIFKYNIYPHIFRKTDSTAFLGELFWYNFNKNNIISWSTHSNKILLLNSRANVLSINTIESNKSKIGDPYFRITKENHSRFNDILNDHEKTSSVISNVLYDSERKIYYIKVLNEVTLKWFNENNYRPWSLLVYDEEFNKLDEIPFEDKKYSGMMKISNRGLMIEVKNEFTDYKNQAVNFEIYNYEK